MNLESILLYILQLINDQFANGSVFKLVLMDVIP